MKKFLTILAVAGVFAACNGGENKDAAADTTKKDTTVVTPAAVDTTKKDTTVKTTVTVDTTKKAK